MSSARRRLALLCAAALLASACGPAESPIRNVIVISIDTLRSDRLGAYGYGSPTSPSLDALAADGVLFEEAVSTSPWTLPSHASLLTGLYPSGHGIRTSEHLLASDVPTLATLLADRGFDTAAFVNAFLLEPRFGLSRGFDRYAIHLEDHSREGATTKIIQDVQAWLDTHRDRPVFLFAHFFDVHSDYRSLPRYEAMFAPEPGRFNGRTLQIMLAIIGRIRPIEPSDAEHLGRLYDAGIRQLDDELGRFFEWLRERGWLDDTLLIVTSDHGEEFLDHGGMIHGGTHYQELLRVPLILYGPGLPAGTSVSTPVSLVDLAPTVLGLLDIEPPARIDGRDLRPFWVGEEAEEGKGAGDRVLLAETGPMKEDVLRSVRRGHHKLIVNIETGSRELYDLREDPRETRNLAAEQPEVTRSLSAALEQLTRRAREPEKAPPLTPEMKQRLRAIGYIEPDG
jgi:arylsulfatase A-like enzyme